MRLSEKKQYRGHFWFPDREHFWFPSQPENRIPGEMVIDTNGSIRLTLEYPSCNENMPRSGSGSRIHGVIEGEFVVLLECERTSWFVEGDPTFTNINKDMYSPQYCIMRQCLEYNYFPEEAKINFNSVDDIEFDTLYFTIDKLVDFLKVDGIDWHYEQNPNYRKIVWNKKSIEIPSCDGFTLKAENDGFLSGNPHHPDMAEMAIKERARWILKFPDPHPLEKCKKKIEHIKEFFSFIFNQSVGITYLAGSKPGEESWFLGQEYDKKAIRHKIHYPIDHLEPTTSPLKREHDLVAYKDFEDEEGNQLFGEYLSSYLKKRASKSDKDSDKWFNDIFGSRLYFLPRPSYVMHLFKELVSILEYVRHERGMSKKKPVRKLATLIKGTGFSCDTDLIKRVREFLQNNPNNCDDVLKLYPKFVQSNSDSDEVVLALYVQYARNTFTHGEKRDVDFGIAKPLCRWLWKITSFYLLSMIKEGDELNRKIVEKSH